MRLSIKKGLDLHSGEWYLQDSAYVNYCMVCDEVIKSRFLSIKIKDKEYNLHKSCALSCVTMVAGAITLIAGLFKSRKAIDNKKTELRNSL